MGCIQTYRRASNIQGCIQIYRSCIQTYWGASKHIGVHPNIWGHQNIQEGVHTYGCMSKHMEGIQTYRWASKHIGSIQTYEGDINIQGVIQKYGGIKTYGGVQTCRGHPNVWGHMDTPQSDKACFLFVVYVQQASKHLPNIQGGI